MNSSKIFFPYLEIIKVSTLFLTLLLISTISFCQEVYKYTSYADHIDVNLWMNEYERISDSEGIVTQKKQYHALSIAAYGIMNYENFIVSGDSAYYNHVINQYKYFCDSSKVDYIDNYQGMGLPYRFKFHDLKSPWYSGMTQGVGISFMLRYYLLTSNFEALKKAEQLAYFMLRPEEIGGTIGKTPEDYTFIEEYPNSKTDPQVLNGFINGLIGLKEYLNFFREDTVAKKIHDESYQAMVNTFNKYDLPSDWTNYNRAKKKISNQYIRYQITELEHLNSIYSDYRLVKQMMIWSYFAYNKLDKELKFYKNPLYQYSVPFKSDSTKISNLNIDFEKTLLSCNNYSITRKSRNSGNLLKHKKTYQISLRDSVYSFRIIFDKNIELNTWELKLSSLSDASSILRFEIDSNKIFVSSDKKFNQAEINFINKNEKKLNINDLQVYNPYQFEIPRFGFYNFGNLQELHADSLYLIQTKGEYLDESIVFYRYSENRESMKNAKYEIDNTISLSNPYFIPEKTGVYQFFMSSPMIKGLWFSKPSIKFVQN